MYFLMGDSREKVVRRVRLNVVAWRVEEWRHQKAVRVVHLEWLRASKEAYGEPGHLRPFTAE